MSDATRPGPTTRVGVREWGDAGLVGRPDRVVTEEPLEIRLAWPGQRPQRAAVTMRTPGHDFELATGFLVNERVIGGATSIRTVAYCQDRALSPPQQYNVVTVDLDAAPAQLPAARFAVVSSACGVCGVESLDDVVPPESAPIATGATVAGSWVATLPELLRPEQALFERTGGLHAAGSSRSTVGRSSSVRTSGGTTPSTRSSGPGSWQGRTGVAGRCAQRADRLRLVQKAVGLRLAAIVAVGAPSAGPVQLADRAGLVLVGFTRRGRCVVYTHPERICL